MNSYNPQMYDESKTIRKQKGNQSGRVFYIILIGLAISGCLILALSLLVPHKTGLPFSEHLYCLWIWYTPYLLLSA